jgi:hypothetical protein
MIKKILCGATLVCAATYTNAATITQEFDVTEKTTGYDETVTFNLFDDMGGLRQLDSVEFMLEGGANGSGSVENRNSTATVITANFSASITLFDMNGAQIAAIVPTHAETETLAAFDGVIDFTGPSGVEFLNLSADDMTSTIITDAIELMDYVGTGTSDLEFQARGLSFVSGGGNITSQFFTSALGKVTVLYNYTDTSVSVNAPTTLALFSLSLAGFAGFRKFKK